MLLIASVSIGKLRPRKSGVRGPWRPGSSPFRRTARAWAQLFEIRLSFRSDQGFPESLDRHPVHTRGTAVALDPGVRRTQGLLCKHLVMQPIPLSSFWPPSTEGVQHALRPHGAFHPPIRVGFSRQHSPRGHFSRVLLRVMRHRRIHLPGALRSTGFHRFPRYYDASATYMLGSRRH